MKLTNYTFIFFILTFSSTILAQLPTTGSNKSAYSVFKSGEKKFYKGNLINGERIFDRAAKRYEKNGNVDGYIASKAMEAILLLKQDRPKEAFKAFKYAEELFNGQTNPNQATKAYLSLCLGKYHLSYNESEEAASFLQTAKQILEEHPEYVSPIFEIELQQSMGELYMQKGEQGEALTFFQNVLEAAERAEAALRAEGDADGNSPLSDEANRLVDGIYDKRAAADEAAAYYKDLLARRAASNLSSREKSKLKLKAGESSFKFTDYESAYEDLMNALDGDLSLEDQAKTKSMLASIAVSMRDYQEALDNNGDALRIQTEIGAPASDLFNSFVKQGKICQELEGVDNSVYWYKKTLKGIEEDWTIQQELDKYKLEGIKHVGDPTLNTSFNVALLNFKRAELLIGELSKNEQIRARIDLYMAKGNLYFKAGYNDNAKVYYEAALKMIEDNYPPKFNLLSETYRYLAAISFEQRELEVANDWITKAMDATLENGLSLNEKGLAASLEDIKYPYEMLYALVVKSAILHSKNSQNPTEANMKEPLIYTEYGGAIIKKLKKIHRHESAKYELSELTEEINHQAIATTRVLYTLSPKRTYLAMVFDFMENSKSSLLLQAIQQLRAQKIVDVPEYVIEKEQKLKTKISYYTSELYYETQLGNSSDQERVLELKKKLKGVEQEYPAYLEYIKKTHPKYYALKYEAQLATMDELQRDLINKETFVNYIVTDSLIHMLLITPSDIQYTTSKTPSNFRNGIARYIASLKGEKPDDFLRYSNLLYNRLIEPIQENAFEKDLIIIPDGILNYIPFEVIPTEGVPQSWPKGDYSLYKEFPYLLKKSTVVYNYSATLFLASRKSQAATITKGFVGYAPSFTNIDSFTLTHKHQKKKYEDLLLEPLENAAIEVAMIGDLTEGETWIGEIATETAFKNDAAHYGVVHFATHGILNNKFPLYSNLVMLGDKEEDGLLHTYELYNMQINAELVALSACNTGVGKIQKGEGAMSIARGFAYAGCPNIAMTLWPVSDQATQILMENFYTNLMMGMPKAEALRAAKLHFIKSGNGLITVPYFWSGMLIVGTPNEIHSLEFLPYRQRHPYIYWGALGSLGLLILGAVVWGIKRKK